MNMSKTQAENFFIQSSHLLWDLSMFKLNSTIKLFKFVKN